MFEVDKLSSFFTKLSKNNVGASCRASDTPDAPMMGASQGVSGAPVTPPCYFFLRTKTIFPIKCTLPPHPLPTTPPTTPSPHHPPHQNPPSHPPTHTTTTTHPPTPPATTPPQEPSNHPPQRKSRALMPDISWAPPHSLTFGRQLSGSDCIPHH